MPDNGRFSDREIESELRDLGARIEYPPTPDLAQAVRRQIDEEDSRRASRSGFWPSFLSPRWTVPAAALVLIAVAIFSPAVRGTLSDLFVSEGTSNSGQQAGAGGSAARPESGGGQEDAGSSVARGAQASSAEAASGSPMMADEATGCPSPSLEAEPARAASGATFRLRGNGFSSGCDKIRPARDIRIDFRQGERTWKLATVAADRQLTFGAKLRVPAGAGPGHATVRATTRSGELVKERFIVLR